MPTGGRLGIRTSEVTITPAYVECQPDARTGPFLVLAISDTGVGMDDAVQKHIFEPFFTTKAPDKGTGMGHAMALGIVNMSDGWIDVKSEPGRGTTFEIYFPRLAGPNLSDLPSLSSDEVPHGCETVLFVEDDPAVRSFGRRCLMDLGYAVLEASKASDALALAGSYPGKIELLLSDIVMPGMQGPDMARRVMELRPGIRVLYSSGFTQDASVGRGDGSSGYLPKPYTRETLARSVRGVLDNFS
jgi:CheY-like chemotaxis protein